MGLELRPITLRRANDFVQEYHRHNGRTARDGGKYALAAVHEEELVGVVIVGRPLARLLDDGWTVEITRCCVKESAPKGTPGFLYAAARRVWQAMGGKKVITYTLPSESGASMRGLGWKQAAISNGHANGWNRRDSPHCKRRHQDIFTQTKIRWESECE